VAENISHGTHPFPSELVSPEKKADKKYGLKWAKAIFYNNDVSGSSMFYNDRNVYRVYMDYALGKQDEHQYKPLLGINSKNITDSMLPSINWGIRNYATKKINVVVSNVSNRGYDPVAKAVDELANNILQDYKSRLKAYVADKDWIDQLKQNTKINTNPLGLSDEEIPTNHEDIEILMKSGFKFRSEMEIEKGIKYHLERCNFEQTRKHIIWDTFTLGVACLHVELDEYGKPQISRISPEDVFLPYTELPDFSNINYAAHIQRMTVSEFKKDAEGQFTDEEFRNIEENHANATERDKRQHFRFETNSANDYRDAKKIRVLKFEFVTQDEIVHLEMKDKAGNDRFRRKPYDYYATAKEQDKFKKKYGNERNIKRTPYTSVYEGRWVVGTDYIYYYKRASNHQSKRNSFGGSLLKHKVFAPNLFSGEVVSTVKQMIPVLDNLQRYQLKIQHMVASAVPKGLHIDLFALANAKFVGKNGKAMTDLEKYEMYLQSGNVFSSSDGRILPGAANKPIQELENGMSNDVAKLVELIRVDLEALDDIVGVNRVMSAGNLHQDTGKATAEMQFQSAQAAIDYIYDADTHIFKEMCKTLSELHIQSVKIGANKKFYNNIMGENSVRWLIKDHGLEKHDFGIYLEPRPDDQSWQRFYMRVNTALEQGQIYIPHATRAERIDNLKEAEMYLEVAINEVQRESHAKEMEKINANNEGQQTTAQQAHEYSLAEKQSEMERIAFEEEQKRETLKLEYELKKDLELSTAHVKGDYKMGEVERLSQAKENTEVLKSYSNNKTQENG
jgi:hypothetical protein